MPNVKIAIISGRGLRDLKDMVNVEGLTYAGNTGLDISFPDGGEFKYPISEEDQGKLKKLIKTLKNEVCKDGAKMEDKGCTATYHYRAVPDGLHAELVHSARSLILAAGFKAGNAHCAIEIIPSKVDWDKGDASLLILSKFFPSNWREIPTIYVGDDVNDECAMKISNETIVIIQIITEIVDSHTVMPLGYNANNNRLPVKKADAEPTTGRPSVVTNFNNCLSGYIGDRNKIVLFLDYDGTLTPIVASPELATIPKDTIKVLETLAGMPNVKIAIISGRGLSDLKNMVNVEGLTYAGNTGLDISFPDGGEFKYPISAAVKGKLKKLIKTLKNEVCKDGAKMEDKGCTATYHYRAVPDGLRAELVHSARSLILAAGFKAGNAHCAIEIIPSNVDWDKGDASLLILSKFFPNNWREIPTIYVGDDVNDECAMKALADTAVTFRVAETGDFDTFAQHRLLKPKSVLNMLKWVKTHFTNKT
ncbi:uncharacterized protein LOC126845883 [Adelges cooleyi]|uniref:uncharacterized protein LOC126845883 n=1 Tax=Adelges cooleyi TaxID=133065 RepID=UPI00217F5E5C|nr:uncharacterized protein LOC126845883 [Adelges cooleyi]